MDIAPTYPIYDQCCNPLTIRGMSHQVVQSPNQSTKWDAHPTKPKSPAIGRCHAMVTRATRATRRAPSAPSAPSTATRRALLATRGSRVAQAARGRPAPGQKWWKIQEDLESMMKWWFFMGLSGGLGDFMGIVDLIMATHGMLWDNYPLVNYQFGIEHGH